MFKSGHFYDSNLHITSAETCARRGSGSQCGIGTAVRVQANPAVVKVGS